MTYQDILVEGEGDFVTITMNRPERRNALSSAMMREMTQAVDEVGKGEARGIIIAGNGPVYSAGHDFHEIAGHDLKDVRELLWLSTGLHSAMQNAPQPVLARVQGLATAAGCQLVASADLAVASENATFQTPGGAGGWFCFTPMVPLSRNVGRKRALEMLMTGDAVDAETALDWGLVNYVVPLEELESQSAALLRRATRGSAFSKGLGKAAFYASVDMDQPKAYAHAVEVMAGSSQSHDAQERIQAFLEKRPPQLKNR